MNRGIKLNVLFGYLNFVVSSVLTFLVSPLLVQYLGISTFGIWKTLQRYLDFASVADGRASQALKWVVANKETSSLDIEKRRAVGGALSIWLYFLPFLALVIFGLFFSAPFLINDLDTDLYGTVRIVTILLGANIVLNPLLGIPDAVLVGTNQGYKSTAFQLFWVVVANLLLLYFAYLGHGLVVLGIVILTTALLKSITVYFVCKLSVKWFGFEKASGKEKNDFFKFSLWVLIWSSIMRFMLSTEVFFLSYFLGPESVSSFTFMVYTCQFVISIALITGSSFTPSLGMLYSNKNKTEMDKNVTILRDLVFLISFSAGFVILFLNSSFVNLWVGQEFFLGKTENALMVLIMLQLIFIRNESQIQDVGLLIKKKVIVGLFSNVLVVVLSYLIFRVSQNVSGLFIGIILGRLPMVVAFPGMVKRQFQINSNLKKYLLGLLSFVPVYFFFNSFLAQNWLDFVIFAFAIFFSVVILLFLLFSSRMTKNYVLAQMRPKS